MVKVEVKQTPINEDKDIFTSGNVVISKKTGMVVLVVSSTHKNRFSGTVLYIYKNTTNAHIGIYNQYWEKEFFEQFKGDINIKVD